MKKVNNKFSPLEDMRTVNGEITKINWNKIHYSKIKKFATIYANEAKKEKNNLKQGENTSELVLRDKLSHLLFIDILGYSNIGKTFNYMGEKTASGLNKRADGLIGEFNDGDEISNKELMVKAVVEWEDSSYNFDINEKNRGVTQGFEYQSLYHWHRNRQKYVIVINFLELRLYSGDVRSAQSFDLTKIDDDKELKQLLVFLHSSRFAPNKNGDSKSDTFYALPPKDSQKDVTALAATKLGELSNVIQAMGYKERDTNVLMTRLLFALFADDTNIFDGKFLNFLKNKVRKYEDGTNTLGQELNTLFRVLNTPVSKRGHMYIGYDDFPYINGNLFKDVSIFPTLPNSVLDSLIDASYWNWSKVNPIIFGSMFEGALDKNKRHDLGAHYTSEKNIRKVIDSLFLDKLYTEFNNIIETKIGVRKNLINFKKKLANLNFLDPACGSGNFLIISYREIRRLEHKVISCLYKENGIIGKEEQMELLSNNLGVNEAPDSGFTKSGRYTKVWHKDRGDVPLIQVEVSQFNGIEIQDYAADVAKVGLWLEDHLMNIEASKKFFKTGSFMRIPLHNGGNIVNGDALKINWNDVISAKKVNYILGNPPFIGAKKTTSDQKKIIKELVPNLSNSGNLDFVCGWYIKSSMYMHLNNNIKASFVSTKSISKGIQAPLLWKYLHVKNNIDIDFAFTPFSWDNKGANVDVVIIGFSINHDNIPLNYKCIYRYKNGKVIKKYVKNINEYLLPKDWMFINPSRKKQISNVSPMKLGLLALDNDNYILSKEEYLSLINKYSYLKEYVHPYYGAKEIVNDVLEPSRYFVYMPDVPWKFIIGNTLLRDRYNKVEKYRQTVSKEDRKLSKVPNKMKRDRYYNQTFIALPRHFTSSRKYLTFRLMSSNDIVSDGVYQILSNDLYIFGVLSSNMHMVWAKEVMGSLGKGNRYNSNVVYNNFIFPNANLNDKSKVRFIVNSILKIRKKYFDDGISLGDLYTCLPNDLYYEHKKLDDFIDSLYKSSGFLNDSERLIYLLSLYRKVNNK